MYAIFLNYIVIFVLEAELVMMKPRMFKLLLLAISLVAVPPPLLRAAIQFYDYKFFTMPETSYYGGIHSIAKDKIGRIWFSGADALFIYDGQSFIPKTQAVTSLSPNTVWSFCQIGVDGRGELYAGTNWGLLKYDYNCETFSIAVEGNIGFVSVAPSGRLWWVANNCPECFADGRAGEVKRIPFPRRAVVTAFAAFDDCVYAACGSDVYRYDVKNETYALAASVAETDRVVDVLDYDLHIWVLTQMDGLFVFDYEGNLKRHIALVQSSGAKKLHVDLRGSIWIATQSGIVILDPNTFETKLIQSDFSYPYSLPNNSVWSIFSDSDGGMWVGTYGGKLSYMSYSDTRAEYFKAIPGSLNQPIVSSFAEDADGNLWIGTEGGGINRWDRRQRKFRYYTKEDPASGVTANMIKKLWCDPNNHQMYVATFNGGLLRYDRTHDRFCRMFADAQPHVPDIVYDFVCDEGGVWMCDPDADLLYGDLQSGRVEKVVITDPAGAEVRNIEAIFRDAALNLWLVTRTGAYVVDSSRREMVAHYYLAAAPYAVNNLCCYCVTAQADIWFGTRGGGINRLGADGHYVNFRDASGFGLDGKTVFGILEDCRTGDLWMSTDDGLWRYDVGSRLFERSHVNDPSMCGSFYIRSCYGSPSGDMMFGGTDGFIRFSPDEIGSNIQRPNVFFTDLLIDNRRVTAEEKSSPLKRSISTFGAMDGPDETLVLTHKQSNFEICFSSDSYLDVGRNRYAYRMLGLFDDWTVLPFGQNSVPFYNLPAGSYTFQIRAMNSDGTWNDRTAQLQFRIKPSPFLSGWAVLFYAVFGFTMVFVVMKHLTDRRMLEQKLALEQVKEQHVHELAQARVKFFTNLSHDMKTPLSLVIDPLEQLKQTLSEDSPGMVYVRLIEKSVERIRRTISRLLQFREIESQKLTLNPQPGDPVHFLENIFSLFGFYADRKGIETNFTSHYTVHFFARFDHEAIEKIFTNLFSNAVKYTTENGYVGVRIAPAAEAELPADAVRSEATEWIAVTVSNTGELAADAQHSVFESFGRSQTAAPTFEESTGLGLAIVKELVSYLGGTIGFTSDSQTVSFSVVLPFAVVEQPEEQPVKTFDYAVSEIDDICSEFEEPDNVTHNRKRYDLVVIEDDADLRNYLERRLSERYNVYTAVQGRDGLERVEKINPAVVVTDLMMPEFDGFELCRLMRSNIKTSHIPIVMLSAMGGTDNKIKALEAGANVFMDKPFDMGYLLRQIDNLISSQSKLRELYSRKYVVEPSKMTISTIDEQLLCRAMEFIEKNMDNNSYDVDAFVSDMAVGRTLLYKKINDLTGMSIKEFIMDVRLKRACQLLRESDLTIAEIALLTGFANPKYFSICFKRRYDQTPTEFKRKGSAE